MIQRPRPGLLASPRDRAAGPAFRPPGLLVLAPLLVSALAWPCACGETEVVEVRVVPTVVDAPCTTAGSTVARADSFMIELFALDPPYSPDPQGCIQCFAGERACHPLTASCRCGPLADVTNAAMVAALEGLVLSDLDPGLAFCVRLAGLDTGPHPDEQFVECDCPPPPVPLPEAAVACGAVGPLDLRAAAGAGSDVPIGVVCRSDGARFTECTGPSF